MCLSYVSASFSLSKNLCVGFGRWKPGKASIFTSESKYWIISHVWLLSYTTRGPDTPGGQSAVSRWPLMSVCGLRFIRSVTFAVDFTAEWAWWIIGPLVREISDFFFQGSKVMHEKRERCDESKIKKTTWFKKSLTESASHLFNDHSSKEV